MKGRGPVMGDHPNRYHQPDRGRGQAQPVCRCLSACRAVHRPENVSGAVDRTRTAVSEYQSLDIRQLDLKVSFAILFGMVAALLLLLSVVWLGLNFANAIVLPLVSVIQAAGDPPW